MTEKQTNVITVNDKEYVLDDMTDRQKVLLSHVQDLDRKIGNTQFALDQLAVGCEAFAQQLVTDLETPAEEDV